MTARLSPEDIAAMRDKLPTHYWDCAATAEVGRRLDGLEAAYAAIDRLTLERDQAIAHDGDADTTQGETP